MNDITEKQERCIHALHRQLGTDVPDIVPQMSRREASNHIDQLKERLDRDNDEQPVRSNGSSSVDDRITLGLAAKLVYQRWQGDPLEQREEFKTTVRELYELLQELRGEVLSSCSHHVN